MIHSLLQKGTGITGDWLSFYLISLGFPHHRIRLSFPLWSTRKTQLPLLGLAKDISSTLGLKWAVLWGLFCHCDKQNKLHAKHSATIFLCAYWFDLSTNGKTKKRTSSKITWSLWHSALSNSGFHDDKLQSIKRNTTAGDNLRYRDYFKASRSSPL